MAVQVTTFMRRRVVLITILIFVGAACVFFNEVLSVLLKANAYYSGFTLLFLLLLLTLFNARKKLPFLPVLRASHWLQFHIYAGFLSVLLFGIHIGFRIPDGILEISLSILFGIVTLSGFIGLYLTRILPPIMTRTGESLTYELIPKFEPRLHRETLALVREAENTSEASAAGDLYLTHLSTFFKPCPTWLLVFRNSRKRLARALEQIDNMARFIGEEKSQVLEEMRSCVHRRHNLNVQKGSQFLLRGWLFIHIPFTYSLLIVSMVHVWIALSYSSFH